MLTASSQCILVSPAKMLTGRRAAWQRVASHAKHIFCAVFQAIDAVDLMFGHGRVGAGLVTHDRIQHNSARRAEQYSDAL